MPVIQISKEQLKQLADYYRPYYKDKLPPYSLFAASLHGTTITAYSSGKVLFQGGASDQEASRWSHLANLSKVSPKNTKKSDALPVGFSDLAVAGSDEVGTGSYFGALSVCATYVSTEHRDILVGLGVQDSKNLTDARILTLAERIKSLVPYQLSVVMPKKYNAIQPSMSQGQMKAVLHNHVLNRLLQKIAPIQPQAILIDQFELPSTYFKHIAGEPVKITKDVFFATKGESHHIAVAAASIIARAAFLDSLDTLSTTIGITLPSGAGSTVDEVAATIITKYGVDALSDVAKVHFANTEKALNLAHHA